MHERAAGSRRRHDDGAGNGLDGDAIRSLCDRCVVMNAGRKIADGPPATVLADEAVITAYLGATAHA